MTIDIKDIPLLIQILDQFYLRRSGKRGMTGNLNFLQDFEIQHIGTKQIEYLSASDRLNLYTNLSVQGNTLLNNYLHLTGYADATAYALFTTSSANKQFQLRVYNGSAYENVCHFVGRGGAGTTHFVINQAGDITFLHGKKLSGPSGHASYFSLYGGTNELLRCVTDTVLNDYLNLYRVFLLDMLSTNSKIRWDSTDAQEYNRTNNIFEFIVGDSIVYEIPPPYAGISVVGNANQTAIAVAGTAVQYTEFNTDDAEKDADADHTNDHIKITYSGKYLILVSIHADSVAGAGADFDFQVYKNNGATAIANVHAHRSFAGGGGEIASVGLSGIATLAANDTIELWVTNDTNTQNIILTDVTLSLVKLGN